MSNEFLYFLEMKFILLEFVNRDHPILCFFILSFIGILCRILVYSSALSAQMSLTTPGKLLTTHVIPPLESMEQLKIKIDYVDDKFSIIPTLGMKYYF